MRHAHYKPQEQSAEQVVEGLLGLYIDGAGTEEDGADSRDDDDDDDESAFSSLNGRRIGSRRSSKPRTASLPSSAVRARASAAAASLAPPPRLPRGRALTLSTSTVATATSATAAATASTPPSTRASRASSLGRGTATKLLLLNLLNDISREIDAQSPPPLSADPPTPTSAIANYVNIP
ncbi:hypothetical protein HK100_010944, partial [Physocladia obscura]